MDRPLLEWTGAVGVVAFPGFYLLHLTGALPPLYDGLALWLVAAALGLLLALRRRWPARAQRFYFVYSYAALVYCLPFFLSFTMLQNGGGPTSIANMLLCTFLIVLVADWRNAIVMLVVGFGLGLAVFRLSHPHPDMPAEFVVAPAVAVLAFVSGALARLAQTRADMERMRQLYAGLAGTIAHEMRNPMLQLRHVLDAVERGLPVATNGAASREHARLIDQLMRDAAQGHKAINRGLQSIAATLQQLKPNALDASALRHLSAAQCIHKAVDEYAFENSGDRHRVHVHVQRDFVFNGQETVLVMIVFNLLKNALRYFSLCPHSSVTITVNSGHAGWIVVRDTGPGVPSSKLEHLFGDFGASGRAEGAGLAFCKRAMLAFGGDISCQSTMGEFTEFTMTFPLVPDVEIEAGQQQVLAHARARLAGKNLLVVDDDSLMRRATSAKLAAMGCGVGEAHDGIHALEMLNQAHYDLVVMDINMPVLDGYETTRRIRQGAIPGRRDLPVLGHSSAPAAMGSVKARQAGMNAFLSKPCTPLEMAQAVSQVLDAAALQQGAAPSAAPAGKAVPQADDSTVNGAVVQTGLMARGMTPVLDTGRIQNFERLGVGHLLPQFIVELAVQARQLEKCAAAIDPAGMREALHSLVGLSGETGAQALHEAASSIYRGMCEGRWPGQPDWMAQLKELVTATEKAVAEYRRDQPQSLAST